MSPEKVRERRRIQTSLPGCFYIYGNEGHLFISLGLCTYGGKSWTAHCALAGFLLPHRLIFGAAHGQFSGKGCIVQLAASFQATSFSHCKLSPGSETQVKHLPCERQHSPRLPRISRTWYRRVRRCGSEKPVDGGSEHSPPGRIVAPSDFNSSWRKPRKAVREIRTAQWSLLVLCFLRLV